MRVMARHRVGPGLDERPVGGPDAARGDEVISRLAWMKTTRKLNSSCILRMAARSSRGQKAA